MSQGSSPVKDFDSSIQSPERKHLPKITEEHLPAITQDRTLMGAGSPSGRPSDRKIGKKKRSKTEKHNRGNSGVPLVEENPEEGKSPIVSPPAQHYDTQQSQNQEESKQIENAPNSHRQTQKLPQVPNLDSNAAYNSNSQLQSQLNQTEMPTNLLEDDNQVLQDTALAKIVQDNRRNKLKHKQFKTAKDFMKGVMYNVPLNRLYKVLASCNYNEAGRFCPVIVEIIDQKILMINKGMPFLLQVWNRYGTMVFEKPLKKPITNWNISDDKFIFQQETNSPDIYVVRLFEDQQPTVFKFMLPENTVTGRNRVNTYYSSAQNQFVIPSDHSVDQSQLDLDEPSFVDLSEIDQIDQNRGAGHNEEQDIQEMQALGEFRSMYDTNKLKQSALERARSVKDQSVGQIFGETIIERAPDKMIDFLDNHILLAYRNSIIYMDVSSYGVIDNNVPSQVKLGQQDDHFIEVVIPPENLFFLDLLPKYKIICIQEIGNGMSAFVLEDMITRQIRFLRAYYENESQTLKLVQLGVLVNSTKMKPAKLLKYRAVAKKEPGKDGKSYMVGLVLRDNGRFEVYSDFMLVNEYINPQFQCVDIETDFNQFYLKFVKDAHHVTEETNFNDLDFQIRQVRHFWRNRISFNTSSRKKNSKSWQFVLHNRISNYFKLYSQILNFSMYMCVSHRNMISVYDMTKPEEVEWKHTLECKAGVIRQMFIKKRSKKTRIEAIQKIKSQQQETEPDGASSNRTIGKDANLLSVYKKFHLVSIVGSNKFQYTELNSQGELRHEFSRKAEGRILSFKDDISFNTGLLYMTDDATFSSAYRDIKGCRLYTFPFVHIPGSIITLRAAKMEVSYELMSSNDKEGQETYCKCLTEDSSFGVLSANKAIFERVRDTFGEDSSENEDEVNEAFARKEFCTAIVITSPTNNKSFMFPYIKERDEETKVIKQMRLVCTQGSYRELDYEELDNDSTPFHQFYITSEEFGDNIDSYAEISDKQIMIYDKHLNMKLLFEGLNIRSCQDIHQGYLYTISDNIKMPYSIKNFENGEQVNEEKYENDESPSGFFVYDLTQLFEGKVEKYKLASAIGGVNNLFDNSKFSERFSFIQNFDSIAVIPFPHLNVINCVGMGQKSEYLIWREKNGFFTALDRKSNLLTWSLASGKLLYSEEQKEDANYDQMNAYEVFRADVNDITYTRNFYSLGNCSVNLLKSREPLNKRLAVEQKGLGTSLVNNKLAKQKRKNQAGLVNLGNVNQLEKNIFQAVGNDVQVEIKNSQQQAELYHFKVMELRTHEDTGKKGECRVRFHFIFDIIKEIKNPILKQFDWDVNSQPQQRLYLSRDTKKLMEVINNFIASVYYRADITADGGTLVLEDRDLNMFSESNNTFKTNNQDRGQQVKWKLQFRIQRFPTSLAAKTSVPYLFSPNFTYQLDFNYRAKAFVIKESATQHIYMYIPSDLINTSWNKNEGEMAIKIICSRIKWEDERILRIINESNLDCLFEMCSTDPNDSDVDARYLKLLSVVKVDNLHENIAQLDSNHYFTDRAFLEPRDVLERLIRTNQEYKTSLQHALNTGNKRHNILEKINKIDFSQPWEEHNSSFDVELSFTWLNWRVSDLVISDPNFDLQFTDKEQQVELCFNILPKGRGILHKLALSDGGDKFRQDNNNDQIQAYEATRDLFDLCRETLDLGITGAEEGTDFEIPILQDIYGATPLDLCLGISNMTKADQRIKSKQQDDQGIFYQHKNNRKYTEMSENFAMANIIFEKISEYSFMHSSAQITRALIKATKFSLPSVGGYMESRMQQVSHCFASKTQREILEKKLKYCPGMGYYGLHRTPIWAPEESIKKELFKEHGALQPMKLQFLDIPSLFLNTKDGFAFIYALQSSTDQSIFALKSVQIMIDEHARHWDRVNYLAVGMPMTIQLVAFWYWSNIIIVNLDSDDGGFDIQNYIFKAILVVTAVYLMAIEISAVIKRRLKYFDNLAKFFSIITPIFIMINVFDTDTGETQFWTIQTWSALFLWLKFLLYLRTVTVFSWIVRMIQLCVYDMLTFLVVLLIGVIAFADAFESIERIMIINGKMDPPEVDPDASYYQKYAKTYVSNWQKSFLTALGEFDDNLGEYREVDWFVFLLCAIFNIILLLNLLIAIISETYTRVSESRVEAGYKEKVYQMSLMQDTVYGFKKIIPDPNELIFVAQVMEQIEEEVELTNKVDQLHEKLDEVKEEILDHYNDKIHEIGQFILDKIDATGEHVGIPKQKQGQFLSQIPQNYRRTSVPYANLMARRISSVNSNMPIGFNLKTQNSIIKKFNNQAIPNQAGRNIKQHSSADLIPTTLAPNRIKSEFAYDAQRKR